ncbi:AAA family ATPase [Adlercreutzia sp. ZJ141]|uniref:AAA family ATPase n=1 Tax=Adlercreutzia sp. ZJ141 TaxID=2709406 RepID=UPI0013E9B06A|nr:AAA family ATPase [Adlercreutzia sp. ZJ141]
MEFLSITVGGFRNLKTTRVVLNKSITSLVSTNNYGKSNFLDAVAFGVQFMNSTPQTRVRMMGDESCMPLVSELDMNDFTFEVEFHSPELGEYQFVRYGFSFAWRRDDGSGERVTGETIELNYKRGGNWSSYLKRNIGKYRPGHSTQRCTRKINLDLNQLAIDVLTAIDSIDINPAIRAIRDLKYGACYPLSTDGIMDDYPLELAGQESGVFSLAERDLPHSLFELKKKYPSKYDEFQSIVCELFPEIVNIDVVSSQLQPEQKQQIADRTQQFQETVSSDSDTPVPYRIRDEVYRIFVTSSHLNQPVSVTRMSDGTKRVIWLVARSVMADIAGVGCLGVEEVETGIHPRMMQDLLESLREVLGETKIILTSHSPHLIQCLPFNSIYVGIPNDNGVASFATFKVDSVNGLSDAAYDRGMSAGEYIFALMSSGEDEEDILKSFLEVS